MPQTHTLGNDNSAGGGMTGITQNDKGINIVKRLEELNKWQETQKRILENRQSRRRNALEMEQKNMYGMLGLQNENQNAQQNFSLDDKSETDYAAEKNEEQLEEEADDTETEIEDYTDEMLEEEQLENDSEEQKHPEMTNNAYNLLKSAYGDMVGLELPNEKPKKPFLKRGQGLKQRFRIDPDEFKLQNLPRYKFANAHPNYVIKPKVPVKKTPNTVNHQGPNNAPNSMPTTTPAPPPASAPAPSPTPLPEQTSMPVSTPASTPIPTTTPSIDAQEERFQQLLMTSKATCNSTPDTKSVLVNKNLRVQCSSNPPQPSAVQDKSHAGNANAGLASKSNFKKEQPNWGEYPPNEGPLLMQQQTTIAWAKVLDPQQLQPIPVNRDCRNEQTTAEDDIFELLEKKAKEGSFDMNSTCIQNFMKRQFYEKVNDSIQADEEIKAKNLQPIPMEAALPNDTSSVDDIEDDVTSLEEDDNVNIDVVPVNSPTSQHGAESKVRFCDTTNTHVYEETSDSSGPISDADNSNSTFFQQFKDALLLALQVKSDASKTDGSDTTLTAKESSLINSAIQKATAELHEKTNMIKMRLADLEKEISTFKENNIQLMKARQDHELQKTLYAQEQLQLSEKLKDEKIQMEIYLHDERMKLEDEKRKYEQQIRVKSQAMLSKDRKEIEKLREQITNLETQLKNKDGAHAAAQARLRTQMRNLEKEQKKLHEDIERLTKENKRLESENLKINREQNHKLLQEINRNIAKLAPKISNTGDSCVMLPPHKNVSKTIVGGAMSNRNFSYNKSSIIPQRKTSKLYKKSRSSLSKNSPKKASPDMEVDTETSPDSSFSEDKESHSVKANIPIDYKQTHKLACCEGGGGYSAEGEDEIDVLKDLHLTPQLVNNTSAAGVPTSPSKCRKTTSPNTKTNTLSTAANDHTSPSVNTQMKREIINPDGSKDIWYPNGNLKKISANGMVIRMLYYNKDIKETDINEGTVKYYYAQTNTWHTTYLDGLEVLEFPNGTTEHRHSNGMIEIYYPNNSVKIFNPHDDKKMQEWRFADGTNLMHMRNGDKILQLPNGQREIHTKLNTRREYPDGTVKTIYPDGSQETRYSNGRVRLRDKDGVLVLDTENVN